ncbi:NADH-quinone oxidoreductase subunit J family protein [Rufibacter latericius]|uniref:NADH-quinone oxidoreductase subunit J n=1 Tax=Rufibacter latericius TaxID=2487040 RepID=A0A3M9MLB4_9BACT|nr:NADH-quinone oxidoreductase subunit J [Rufibacter latericius]RNI26269.1 NADH-quinone oxidoreductase subunit J [Rufibacter latericius]
MTGNFFYFLTFLTLFAAIGVVVSKNPVYSVLFMILTFFALTGHYILLNAQFLAAVNFIVYMGAIMVLFLFVIMFLNMREDTEQHKPVLSKIAAAIAGGILFVVMIAALKDVNTQLTTTAVFDSQIGMVENLGKVLFRDYLLPFELASVLFLAAMAGAVMLGKREPGEQNRF